MSPSAPAAARQARPLLTEGAVGKTLVVFSLPILVSNVLQSLNGSVNSIWVGRYLGSAALTATSNANTIMFFLIGIVFGVGMASSILVGQSIGAQDVDRAKRIVGTSASFFILAALGISMVGFFFSPQLLGWMRTPADALPFAIAYLRVIFVGMPFIFAYAFVTVVLRGAGDARTPLFFSMLSVGLDIGLNPLLMFGVGPFPRLGIAGAATATLTASRSGGRRDQLLDDGHARRGDLSLRSRRARPLSHRSGCDRGRRPPQRDRRVAVHVLRDVDGALERIRGSLCRLLPPWRTAKRTNDVNRNTRAPRRNAMRACSKVRARPMDS